MLKYYYNVDSKCTQLSLSDDYPQAKRAQGRGETFTRGGSYGNGDASISTHPCYWPSRVTKSASETEYDEARRNEHWLDYYISWQDRGEACGRFPLRLSSFSLLQLGQA